MNIPRTTAFFLYTPICRRSHMGLFGEEQAWVTGDVQTDMSGTVMYRSWDVTGAHLWSVTEGC